MKSRFLIIAGCLLALGIASCGGGQDEPGMSDSTSTHDSMPAAPAADTSKADTTKLDTTLIDKSRTDTAIITTDTTVKPGKTTTTGTRDPKGSSSKGSVKTTSTTPAEPTTHGSTTRRPGEGTSTESKPRR